MVKIDFLITRNRCRAKEGNLRDVNLIKAFIEKGYSCGLISSCPILHEQLKKESIFSFQMQEAIKVPEKLTNMVERASRIEKEYQIASLKRFIFPERCYYQEDEDYLFRKAIVYFEELEKFFDGVDVKCLIQDQSGQINIRALYHIAKKRKIAVIYPGENLFPGKMLFYYDEMKDLSGFKDISWEKMTMEQKESIEDYLRRFRKQRGIFNYSLLFTKKDKLARSFIGMQDYLKNKQFRGLREAFLRKIKWLVSNNLNKFFSRFLCQTGLPTENFVYFPLHVPDDSQITLRNLQFYDQSWLILYIARSLPYGCKLYVKEHPECLISLRDKKKILQEKNVVLLNQRINSHEIVKKAKAIIIINSSVGFVALHYFKPIIVLGNWILRGRGVTIDVENLAKLDEVVRLALTRQIDQNKIKAFLFSLQESTLRGVEVEATMDYNQMVNSLVKKYKEFKISH